MFLWTPSCILTMTQCSQSRLRSSWMYALHAEGVGVHLYVILATVSSGPAAGSVFPQFPDWLTRDNLSELSEMAWSDFFLHIPPALRNEIRRSQIDGWLTGVDRHIALTSVKKNDTRKTAGCHLLFNSSPSRSPTVVRVKNLEVWKISIFVEAVTAVSCWCSTKETASKRRHFSLYPSKCGIHVSSNTSTVLWKVCA